MRRALKRFLAIGLTGLTVGCAASPRPTSLWITDHGGVLATRDSRQVRIDGLCQKLSFCCSGRKITVQVLATDVVTAYSLWNGHIFVTRGLMDHVDDEELQAAVAHELGHLLDEGHVQSVASLRGCCVDPDREVRADALGARLLLSQGLAPRAMISMLQKVEKFGSLPPACRIAVETRISLLSARLPTMKW